MATYPDLKISSRSKALPDAGILEDFSEDGTEYTRRDWAATKYRITVIHQWITLAEFDQLIALYDSGLGPHDVTVNSKDYSAKFIDEPRITERRGPLVVAESLLSGVRSGW